MPIIYKGKSAVRIVYKGREAKKVIYKGVQVYIFGWLTRVILSWSLNSRPSKKEVPNPEYPKWEEGRIPYVKAIEEAEKNYQEWINSHPQPSKEKDNPEWRTWYEGKKPYQDAYNEAKRHYDRVLNAKPEREIPNPDFDQDEKDRLTQDMLQKNEVYQAWKAANPQPPVNIPNPDFDQAELDRLRAEEEKLKEAIAAHKEEEPPKFFTEVNPEWDTWNNELTGLETDASNKWQEYNDAVAAGVPDYVASSLKAAAEAADSRVSTHKSKEPKKWINVPNPDWAEWERTGGELEAEYAKAKDARETYSVTHPVEIENPAFDEWFKEDVVQWAPVQEATHALRLWMESHPEKIPNPAYSDWYYNEYQPAKTDRDSAKSELDTYTSSNPEPERWIPNPEYDKWVSEKNTVSGYIDTAKNALKEYDKKKPSKTIWIPITLYKCALTAKLEGTPPAGRTSKDTVTVSLESGKYTASLVLSFNQTSNSIVSTHESEDKPDIALLKITSYEGTQSNRLPANTSWTSGNINFRLN